MVHGIVSLKKSLPTMPKADLFSFAGVSAANEKNNYLCDPCPVQWRLMVQEQL